MKGISTLSTIIAVLVLFPAAIMAETGQELFQKALVKECLWACGPPKVMKMELQAAVG